MPRGVRLDLTGQRFGRWTVLRVGAPTDCGHRRWTCRCECGGEGVVIEYNLTRGISNSCGCYQRERASTTHKTHGAATAQRRGDRPPEYRAWQDMLKRCFTRSYKYFPNYGGRGITVCAEWRNNYLAFREHIGPKPSPDHSVDRINNARGYEPGNVRWATRSEQMQNTRHNVNITHDGETFCAAEWARRTGVVEATLVARIHRGVPAARALDPRPIGRYEMSPRTRAASSRQLFTDG